MSEAPPRNFLGLPAEVADPKRAAVHILPVPYEATTSYLGGARNGPQAILDASRAVELYDHELDDEPYVVGVATLPEVHLTVASPEAAMGELRRAYARVADRGKFVIMLGGEHSISGPPILEHAARLRKKGRKLSVLQLDAHGDLRDTWEGTPFSHACVMRRVADHVNLVQVGIRAIDASERRLMRRRKDTITTVFAEEVASGEQWIDRVLAALGKDVYLTIDVDYFDPSLVPSTGTPEPGGGTWYPTMRLLERVFQEKRVVAADVVELAPIPGMAAPDFLVAKLVYRLVGYYGRYGRRGRKR
ncbi:MAG: agmatinase [Gemmatimonadota bacterium]